MDIFLYDVEFVLLPDETPDNGNVFDDNIDRDRAQCSQDAREELNHSETVQGERFYHPENVHVDVETCDESAQKVHHVRTGNRVQSGENHVRSGQGHRDPGVHTDGEQKFVVPRDRVRVHHQQDSLQPAFPLLQEVQQGER